MTMNRSRKKTKKKHPVRNAILIILGLFLVTGTALAAVFYQTARVNVDKTYAPLESSKDQAEATQAISESRPLSFLIMGLDSRDEDLSGRTDSLMVVTLNPQTNQTTMVSIPRDTFIEAEDGSITAFNKINAVFAQGGAAASIAAVNQLLHLEIDHYITMNFSGIEHLVDALGGVTVNSDFAFTVGDMEFHEGANNLNGKQALAFTRMRHDDVRGTYGRDERQQKVIAAILTKMKSPQSLTAYQGIFEALGGNVKTDVTWSQIQKIILNYNQAFGNVVHESVQGQGQMLNNLSFQVVSEEERTRIHDLLQEQLTK